MLAAISKLTKGLRTLREAMGAFEDLNVSINEALDVLDLAETQITEAYRTLVRSVNIDLDDPRHLTSIDEESQEYAASVFKDVYGEQVTSRAGLNDMDSFVEHALQELFTTHGGDIDAAIDNQVQELKNIKGEMSDEEWALIIEIGEQMIPGVKAVTEKYGI